MDGNTKLVAAVVTFIIIALLGWVGTTVNGLQISVARAEGSLQTLTTNISQVQKQQESFVPKSVLDDKFSDLNRRMDKLETRVSLNERSLPDTTGSRVVDGDDSFSHGRVKITQ